MVRVKVCGLTRAVDALAAEAAGVDAVGVVFAPSSRRLVGAAQAREVLGVLGPLVTRVGVFQGLGLPEVLRVVAAVGLDAAQVHDDWPPDDLLELAAVTRVIVARRVRPGAAGAGAWPAVGSLLLDGPSAGSGQAWDWSGVDVSALAGRPWLLAGGLTPLNVGAAVRALHPWGVDVSSGVENSAGIKDEEKLRSFVRAARFGDPA